MNYAYALLIALLPTVAIIGGYLHASKERNELAVAERKRSEETRASLDEIHALVNAKMSVALERIEVLERALNLEPGEKV